VTRQRRTGLETPKSRVGHQLFYTLDLGALFANEVAGKERMQGRFLICAQSCFGLVERGVRGSGYFGIGDGEELHFLVKVVQLEDGLAVAGLNIPEFLHVSLDSALVDIILEPDVLLNLPQQLDLLVSDENFSRILDSALVYEVLQEFLVEAALE
jgi:hypothetical protein